MDKKLLYFGCIGQVGHYLFWGNSSVYERRPDLIPGLNHRVLGSMDATFCPVDLTEGKYQVSVVPPVIIVSWWDNSVDKRPGSNSNLIGYGYVNAEEIIQAAWQIYPQVMGRQRQVLTPSNK